MTTAKWIWRLAISVLALLAATTHAEPPTGYTRELCKYRRGQLVKVVNVYSQRLFKLREEIRMRATLHGPQIDGYILPSTDEHLNQEVAKRDQYLNYLTGFTGIKAFAAITQTGAALWVEKRYAQQADGELHCDWDIFLSSGNVSIAEWLGSRLHPNKRVAADPHLVPHFLWMEWERDLSNHLLQLVKVNRNFVDLIWGDERPKPDNMVIHIQPQRFAGERWENKIEELRRRLSHLGCDAMVVTSLTEIAYILNIRGRDIPHTPVVKSYLIVSHTDIFYYVERFKIDLQIDLHLHTDCVNEKCVKIKEYYQVWNDIRTYAQIWKRVLVPAPCVQDLGASEAIFTSMPLRIVVEHVSPIIFMRAQKNLEERRGMQLAHVRDGAAFCEAMSNLEARFATEQWTEEKIKYEVERTRLSQKHARGLSLRTVVAFGEHSALPYYISSNVTDIEVSEQSLLVIESGGQYYEGTTDVSRTLIFGEPTAEMKRAYTIVLMGMLRLAEMKFPSDLKPSGIDALVRSPIWENMADFPQRTGHGIGAFGAVEEPPISVDYSQNDNYHFKDGYFFSSESGYYKPTEYGVRLKNVFEVVDTGNTHTSGAKFLAFQDVTLVPYEPKLIDGTLLSSVQKSALNEYNSLIRNKIGEELKRQGNMVAFYWMMNKTRHVREYLTEEEYRAARGGVETNQRCTLLSSMLISLICFYGLAHWIL